MQAVEPDTTSLRDLPSVEEVLRLMPPDNGLPRDVIVDAVRAEIARLRRLILDGGAPRVSAAAVARQAARDAARLRRPSLRRVVNASGVIIHTNLGRSPLAPQAAKAVDDVIRGYSTLEYDTGAMARGSRHAHCERLICALTGAEAAIAVNNNAAAVMLVLSEFAAGREAIVSRGELVEIGGSFRIPDIMELSRARMVEVGTTNKTRVGDYAARTTADTALLLKVHQSNYRMVGFTESVGVRELRKLADGENARRRDDAAGGACGPLLVYEDQGSGAFERLDAFGEYAEPTIAESLSAGADLVSFSGDKLLGGPQAGVIVGSAPFIDRLKANPLARALRLDKMTLAALEATLRLYLDPDRARRDIPTLRMLTEPADVVRKRAEQLAGAIAPALPWGCAEVSVVPEVSRAGGGALPMCDIPTFAVAVSFLQGGALDCARHLERGRDIPVVARIHDGKLLLDARTLLDGDEVAEAARGVVEYFAGLGEE